MTGEAHGHVVLHVLRDPTTSPLSGTTSEDVRIAQDRNSTESIWQTHEKEESWKRCGARCEITITITACPLEQFIAGHDESQHRGSGSDPPNS